VLRRAEGLKSPQLNPELVGSTREGVITARLAYDLQAHVPCLRLATSVPNLVAAFGTPLRGDRWRADFFADRPDGNPLTRDFHLWIMTGCAGYSQVICRPGVIFPVFGPAEISVHDHSAAEINFSAPSNNDLKSISYACRSRSSATFGSEAAANFREKPANRARPYRHAIWIFRGILLQRTQVVRHLVEPLFPSEGRFRRSDWLC
jgi:hypothetical protein